MEKFKILRQLVIDCLETLKAENIVILDVRHRASFTDAMIFASGYSSRHVSAIAVAVIDTAKIAGIPAIGTEGISTGEWALVDLGDIVVHVMLPDTREFYEVEKHWCETA